MRIKLPFGSKLHISLETKKSQVLQDIEVFGRHTAVTNFIKRHGCSYNEALNYFKKIGHWHRL